MQEGLQGLQEGHLRQAQQGVPWEGEGHQSLAQQGEEIQGLQQEELLAWGVPQVQQAWEELQVGPPPPSWAQELQGERQAWGA